LQHHDFVLTLACPDAKGVVFRVSQFLFERGCNILDSAQFGDEDTGLFFMRVHFDAPPTDSSESLSEAFRETAGRLSMRAQIRPRAERTRTLVLVSKAGHCLNDLLFRVSNGLLPIDLVGVASNHPDLAPLCHHHGIAFHHLPIEQENKRAQEQRLVDLAAEQGTDLVVLARYMQILSEELCAAWSGRAINIHHSFLPSFKGARPYHQAYQRGVKIIGATAHYVTTDLDEGPIIEQDIERVDHTLSASELAAIGADIESRVLSRAVLWHAERRVLVNGPKTVVFR
jgi:formyltetrahydrofolate deformylase